MSIRIFKDVEEALAREVRRITHHDDRTVDDTSLEDTFDPFTGEIVKVPVEPRFYDSSTNAQNINYPNLYIKLLRTREDRFSGKVIPQYGKQIQVPVKNRPRSFEVIAGSGDGSIDPGDDLITSLFQIKKVTAGHLLRLTNGNNKGTYTIASVTPMSGGSHVITVSSELLSSLPGIIYEAATGKVIFKSETDMTTVRIGDNFVDSLSTAFSITSIGDGYLIVSGGTPDLSSGGKVTRAGAVFVDDTTPVSFMILDPTKPVTVRGGELGSDSFTNVSPAIPIDAYYLIRIDSKERKSHIEILNRMWEEFNPPRTALPTIIRTALSAETLITADITTGGSSVANVENSLKFNLGDTVYVFDDITPSKDLTTEGFEALFTATVVDKPSSTQITLDKVIPDSFLAVNCPKIVSNADYCPLMFHFVDHKTRDVEAAQYWVHEFTFWVQIFVDRLAGESKTGVVTSISVEDIDDVYDGDPY